MGRRGAFFVYSDLGDATCNRSRVAAADCRLIAVRCRRGAICKPTPARHFISAVWDQIDHTCPRGQMGTKPAKVTQRPSSPAKNCEKGTRSSLKLPGRGSNLLKSRRLLMSTTLVPRGGGEQRYHRGSRVPHTRPYNVFPVQHYDTLLRRRGARASRGPRRVVGSRWRVRPRGCTAGAAPPRRGRWPQRSRAAEPRGH